MTAALGHRISSERKKKGLSQRELALKVGISGPYLNDIEHGRYRPADETVVKIANALELDVDNLCAVAGTMPTDVQRAAAEHPEKFQQEFAAFRRAMGIVPRREIKKQLKKD